MDIEKQIEQLKKEFHFSFDLTSRILIKGKQRLGFLYLKSFIDQNSFSEGIYSAISRYEGEVTLELLQHKIIRNADVKVIAQKEIVENVLKGSVIIFLQEQSQCLSVDIQFYPTRTPNEPPTSPVIQGPREGFVEDLKTNITLMRRRLYSKDLVLKQLKVGRYSNTQVVVCYLDGVANKEVVKEVIHRLKKIDIDGVVDSYYILTFMEKRPDSLFKQVGNIEKPDIVASKVLEGKVAIIVDNSPIVLTIPFSLVEEMQSSNDYYTVHHYATLVRVIRLFGIMLSILAPGLYLALQLFHYNIIPLNFLITVSDTTQGLPFTPFIEMIFIMLLFQILYEVSLRLPSYLGLATSIVGALILGDTGVKAGLISPPGVIVAALSKIALYTAPEQGSQITVLQFVFMFLGGSLGILGLIGGLIYVANYLNTLDSYGTPYLAPYSPRIPKDLKDGIFKAPITQMKTRPQSYSSPNRTREGKNER